ncbi:toxin Cry1Ac domain D-VI-related protein, partial [Paenilisteria rocourtiae]
MRKKVLATITAASIATSTVMSPVSVFAQSVKQAEGTVDVAEAEAYDYSNLLKNKEFKINPDKTLDHWKLGWPNKSNSTLSLTGENELMHTYKDGSGATLIGKFKSMEEGSGGSGFVYTATRDQKGEDPYHTRENSIKFTQKVDMLSSESLVLRFSARASQPNGEKLSKPNSAKIKMTFFDNQYVYNMINSTEFQEYTTYVKYNAKKELVFEAIAGNLQYEDVKLEVKDLRLVSIKEEERVIVEGIASVNALFKEDNPVNTIKETITQADIDAAQAKVDAIKDNPATTAELQAHVDKAQAEFDAKKEAEAADKGQQAIAGFLVNQLYQNNNPATDAIKATTNQAAIDEAQAQIDKLLPSAVKTDLQNKLNRAQELLDAQKAVDIAVNELFEGNNPANKIKETVTQADIDAAQAKVDKVTDPAKKAELQAHIDKAQAEFDAKKEAEAADKEQQLIAGFLVNQLYQDNNPATDAIKATTTQATIDTA